MKFKEMLYKAVCPFANEVWWPFGLILDDTMLVNVM